jgi:hypothetical protein
LTNFVTQLDWAAFGSDSTVHSNLWTEPGSQLSVSTQDINASGGEGARSAVNLGSVYYNGTWYDYSSAPVYVGNVFVGHFNSPTSPYTTPSPVSSTDFFAPGIPGDHLIGLAGNGLAGSTNKALVVDFGSALTNFAFRIAAVNLSTFNVTLKLFDGANGSGNLLGTYNFADPSGQFAQLTGGGTCAADRPGYNVVPSPCNDAMLIAAIGAVNTRSIAIQTNDPSGFYIGSVLANSVPEPATYVFAGCGILLLFLGRKKFRRA